MPPHLYLYADDGGRWDVNDGCAEKWRWLPEHWSGTVLLVLLLLVYHCMETHSALLGTTRQDATSRRRTRHDSTNMACHLA